MHKVAPKKKASKKTTATRAPRIAPPTDAFPIAVRRFGWAERLLLIEVWANRDADPELRAIVEALRSDGGTTKLGKAARTIIGIRGTPLDAVRSLLRLANNHNDPSIYGVCAAYELGHGLARMLGKPAPNGDAVAFAQSVVALLPKRGAFTRRTSAALVSATLRAIGFSTSAADDLMANARRESKSSP